MDGIEPTRRRAAAQLTGRADAQARSGVLLAACALAALAPRLAAQSEDAAQRIAREVVPQVERAVVCEDSWHKFCPGLHCPVEAGSQTGNSALMGEAKKVVSL